jgi:beta-galactosidase
MKLYRLVVFMMLALLCTSNAFAQNSRRLINNWEFLKQDVSSIWETVRPYKTGDPEASPIWDKVTLPHCFNATDAVDPDVNYYEGPAWYRTQLEVSNPYPKGRTVLHFEGAGQKTAVYIYTTKIAEHFGGYDEWTVDITDAIEAFKKLPVFQSQFKGKIPLEIRSDNTRDNEMIPSTLSDFNVYGGIYRYLNLVYTPQLNIDHILAHAEVDAQANLGKLSVRAALANPDNIRSGSVTIQISDPTGKQVASFTKQINTFKGDSLLWETQLKKPQIWSTDKPVLYTVKATLTAGDL